MSKERERAEPGRLDTEASEAGDGVAEAEVAAEVAAEAETMSDAAAPVDADLAQLRTERDELVDTARRLQADFENFKKRMLREQTDVVSRATERLVEELLPVLDTFELALLNLPEEGEAGRLRKGVELVFAELVGVLEKHGLERIVAEGQPFDPTEHEAVLHEDRGDAEHPVVAQTMRTGYRLRGRVLRPAMVKVVR